MKGPLDLRRWEIKLLPGEDPQAFGHPDNVRNLLAEQADLSKLEIWRSAVYRFHAIVAEEWRKGRVFLAGDACHQTPPFLGQGLCGGIRDVINLAWKLELVLDGIASDTLLDSYTQERKPHIRTVVAHAKEFGEVIGELDLERAKARDKRLGEAMASGQSETVRQKYIPDIAHGLIDKAHGGGALFPQPQVTDGKTDGLLDDALARGSVMPRFLLATIDATAQRWPTPASAAVWDRLKGQRAIIAPGAPEKSESGVLHFEEADGLFATFMQAQNARVVIVRPDRTVYAAAKDAGELNAAIAALGSAVLA